MKQQKMKVTVTENGAMDGVDLRVPDFGLSEYRLSSVLDSNLHLRLLPRVTIALRPANQISASSLSLHICTWISSESNPEVYKV